MQSDIFSAENNSSRSDDSSQVFGLDKFFVNKVFYAQEKEKHSYRRLIYLQYEETALGPTFIGAKFPNDCSKSR